MFSILICFFQKGPSSSDSPHKTLLGQCGEGLDSLAPFFAQGDLRMKSLGDGMPAWIYSFLAIHIFTACSTARVKSPFFPPNFSIALNLSCFSSSSESSTHIRPIFNRRLISEFFARFDVSNVFPISDSPGAKFLV